MTKEFWINLPVKNVKRSKEFFEKIGFSFNTKYGNSETSISLVIGSKGVIVMLFEQSQFEGFARTKAADTTNASEMLLSFDAESRGEVDDMANKVKDAGGDVFAGPGEKDGWMYGLGFADPDGHRWNMLHMDMSKMPQG